MLRQTITASMLFLVLVASRAAVLADETPKVREKELEGDWQQKAVVINGRELSPDELTNMVFTYKAGAMTFVFFGEETKVMYKVDTAKKPKTIDFTPDSGFDKGKTSLGIYEVRDNELRICHSKPGKDRPTEFSSKEGSGHILITLKPFKK